MTCIGLLIIFFCPVEAPKAPASTYCQIHEPVRPSRSDTQLTQIQAAREYAKWQAVCRPKP